MRHLVFHVRKMQFKLTPPPRTVLGVTGQTPFTYLAQVIELNFVQGGGGETLLGPVYECVLPVAANCIQKCVRRGKYWTQNLLTRIVVPIKKAHSNATNLFYWGNGNTYSKRHCLMVRHTCVNMVVLYRVTDCPEWLSVSNFSYPVEYHFSQVKNCSHLLVRPVSNVMLLPCRTQFINYRYIRIHFKSSLNRFLLFSSFVFCKSNFYRLSYIRRPKPSCATVRGVSYRTTVAGRLEQV